MPPDDALPASRWRARLALDFERRAGRTVLAARRHEGPLVVQKPLYPEGDEVCHAIVVHPPAGIAGGDELEIDVRTGPGSYVLLTTPGAGKWYRTSGPWARQQVAIEAAADARVEWLPQETIVYEAARADIRWTASLHADARVIAWDILCLGRTGSGEGFERGELRVETRVTRAGKLAWLERGRVAPSSRIAKSPAGLGGHSVLGTMIVAAPGIEDAWLASSRQAAPRSGESAVTRMPGLLVARYRGDSSEAARLHFIDLWKRLRAPVMGRDAIEPRIWRT